MMSRILGKLKIRISALGTFSIGWLMKHILPLNENKFFCMCMSGNGYGDSIKNLSDYIKKNNPRAEVVWAFSSYYFDNVICDCKKVKLYSLKYYYHVVTAKYILTNFICNEMMLLKRKHQVKLQTWHGTALKKIGLDSEGSDHSKVEMKFRPDIYKREEEFTDIFISGSAHMTQVYHRALKYSKKIYETGSPRNDIFFHDRPDIKGAVRKYFDIGEDKKTILYAPTFRSDGKFTYYDVDLDAVRKFFSNATQDEYVVIVRLHPGMAKKSSDIRKYFKDEVIDATFYPDMQELLYATDVLITDYSSSMFDFMYLYKPVIMYTPDWETYNRGFYFDIESLPFITAYSNAELGTKLSSFDMTKYKSEIDRFIKEIGSFEDGKATERVYQLITSYSD